MEGNFTEDDKKKLVDFINFIATKAKLSDISIQENIKFYGLLSFIQKELIPKIDRNILEIIQVNEADEVPPLPESKE
jgi:hypothetical protein